MTAVLPNPGTMTDTDLWAEAQQWQAATTTPGERWPAPGDLAQTINPKIRQTPALELIDQALVDLLNTSDGRLIISMPPQEGKALSLATPIPTPTGWTTMGKLRPGDEVFGGDGQPCRVTWVSPTWRDRPCYEVTTGDGERIVADAAHEWVAQLTHSGPRRLYTTVDLAKPRGKNARIIGPASLDLPVVDLPIDPYVLGVWLGDGDTNFAHVTSHTADVEVRERCAAAGWALRKVDSGRYRYSMVPEGWAARTSNASPARKALCAAGVWGNKHIPAMYLRASHSQRLALLQGLVDTDGYVMPKGQVEFCSTRLALAEGVRELVYSLGAKAVMTTGRAVVNGKDCGPKYRVRFYLADAAHLSRKARHCKDSSVARVRYVSAAPTASVPTACIEVDSPDHTFLAGRTMLPTHNSQRTSRAFPLWALLRNRDTRVGIASYEQGVARRWGRAIRDDITSTPGLGLAVRQDVAAQAEWQLEGHEGGVYAAGIGGALTGRPLELLIIDDPIKDRIQADSLTYRDRVWDWWTDVASTRLAPGAPVVVILTRWHEDDLAGRLLSAEDGHLWNVINIPAQADHRPEEGETDPLGREPGEFMLSARGRTVAQWEAIRVRSGPKTWASLYQGRPSPAEGGLFPRTAWARYAHPLAVPRADGAMWVPLQHGDQLAQSWDMAFKGTDTSDYVVGGVWLKRGPDLFLLDMVRARLTFTETIDAVKQLTARWPQAIAKLVEDKANGTAVIDQLKKTIPGFIPVQPEGGKEARAHAASPLVFSHNVVLPEPALLPNVGELVEEAAVFPNGKNDDAVDMLTQAVLHLLISPLIGEGRLGSAVGLRTGRGARLPGPLAARRLR